MMKEEKKETRGRKALPDKEKKVIIPVFAKKKNHTKILKHIKPIIKELDV
jgi:DNA-directed RNA polymerase specialized sigma subunit